MFVLEQIHATALRAPDKLAVGVNGRSINYSEFWRLIEACRSSLATRLPDHGVALLSVQSLVDAWILTLALRALGLDVAALAQAEQTALFQGLDVACVITLTTEPPVEIAELARALSLRLEPPSRPPTPPAQPLPPLPSPLGAGAQILLTSGTTGVSKKVRLTYGCTRGRIDERVASYGELGESFRQQDEDSILNILTLGLWTGAGHLWPIMTWCLGGGVVMHEGDDFERALAWPGLTHTLATPAYIGVLMGLPDGAFPRLPDMQLCVVSGGLTPAAAREVRRRLTPRILINLSSTEGGGWARTAIQTDEDLRWYRLSPDRIVEVVDDADNPLPAGELGRVRVRSREVTSYLDDPETSARFFSDGWFYPGDMGVLDGKGRLALYGRTTDIVHIRGNKFPAEPWEREIQQQLACDGVCLLSGSWKSEGEELHLFIESREPVDVQALTRAVQSTLSGFPGVHIHVVQLLPRTASGKIRRIALAQALHDGAYA